MRILYSLFILLCMSPGFLCAQSLQLEEIMNGEDFVGYLPENISWSPDSKIISFSWNPDRDLLRQTHTWNAEKGITKLTPEEIREWPSGPWVWNKTYQVALASRHGDIFLWEAASQSCRQLTATLERESNPFFGKTASEVVYTAGNNLFLHDLTTSMITQLTDFQKGQKKREPSATDQDALLAKEQVRLSSILQARKEVKQAEKDQNEKTKPKRPLPIYMGENRLAGLSRDHSLRFITWSSIHPGTTTATQVPTYVTVSGYSDQLRARPKVGHQQDMHSFHCYDRQLDTTYQLSVDSLPGIYQKPAFQAIYHTDSLPWNPTYTIPKPVIFHGPVWSESGLALLDIKSLDHKDRWIVIYNPVENKVHVVDHQHDDCWIGGPGIVSWTEVGGQFGWMDGGETVWFLSEETGYAHMYKYHLGLDTKSSLTSGSFEILNVDLSRDRKTFYIRANAEGPAEQHFYHLSVTGGPMTRITDRPGNYEVTMSPDEKQLAIRYSFANKPWDLYVMANKPKAKMTRITQSTTSQFEAYDWRVPEIIQVPADDGARVPARIYRPKNPNGGAVIFVHGAGYLQNVHHWWSSYYREYMFHNLLCDEGFTVLDMDYRASSGYGRDWRTAIYRHMGGRDLADQVDGARFLADSLGIDADRIGMYGGSYGGFITLMALFKHPGTFACGAALRSVTDWAHYNDPYTANILNTPVEDSIAYRLSSPIYYAEGLADPLVILHGMVDENVQFQDVVRLSQRLIELGKRDWELAVFPLEDHGLVAASSWKDEYRRIHELFRKHLLPSEH